jgi:hypothetical protein
MIYIKSFKNYEEFKVLFGVVEHGNGVKSRKNKILLACLKDRKLLHWWLSFKDSCDRTHRSHLYKNCDYLRATSMDDLKYFAKKMMNRIVYNDVCGMASPYYCIDFGDLSFTFYSSSMRLDGFKGICADGDSKAVRYENVEREKVFKMKAGKFITRCIEECRITRDYMPEQLKRWIGEEFAREWQVFAEQRCTDRYTLHVDDNFEDIYDSGRCYGDFGSCMTDKDQHTFYRDAIEAKAAYITDEYGWIVARCIVYTDVIDENGNHYRLAERQYSMGQDNVLKQILVDKLIKAGEIDGYKRVGVDCHDNKNFVRNDGSSMRDLVLHIACCLEAGNTLSYQDSFIYYNHDEQISYNDSSKSYSDELNTTDSQFGGGGNWSDYYGEYIPEEESVYDDYYEDWMWNNQQSDAIYRGERIVINDGRASMSDDWYWSNHEDAYLYDDDCCYVDSVGDSRLVDDCILDIDGNWQLKEDCEYSDYHEEYIPEKRAVWSDAANSWLDAEKDSLCPVCGEYFPGDTEDFYSEITGECYCSEKCMEEDEAKFRREHALLVVV